MNLADLLDQIAGDPDCTVDPPSGQPRIAPTHVMPEDVRTFFNVCGGVTIGRSMAGEVRLVGPHECVLANDVILAALNDGEVTDSVREELRGHPSWDWYIVADLWNGDYVVCDFGQARNGNCYQALWDEFPGRMPIVAVSFAAFIEQLYEHIGQGWYWAQPGFQSLGDANDPL